MKIKTIATGLSLPIELKEQMDMERGDVSLSRYILRILEKHYHRQYVQTKQVQEKLIK